MTTVESLAPIAPPPSRLPNVGTTIFTVMSALAVEKQAVNLGQGFPDFDCDPRIVDAVSDAMRAGLNQYPPMTGVPALRQAIAAKIANLYGHAYDADREITITAGATQALLTTVLCCVHPGDEVIVFEPTYDSYIPSIELAGGKVVPITLNAPDFRIPFDTLAAAITRRTRLIMLNTPHNPTGGLLGMADIELLVRELPEHLLLHFDEAYYEFGRHAGGPESLPILAKRRGPWIATRSFSKAYGLAGARVGYGITSSRELADAYRKIRINFSVNAVALAAARAALDQPGHLAGLLDHTAAERVRLAEGLTALGFQPLPSAANFVTVVTPRPAAEIAQSLRAKNIFVLPFPWPQTPGALRITVGTRQDTDAFLAAIRDVMGA